MPSSLVPIDSLVQVIPSSPIIFNVTLKSQTVTKMYIRNITDDILCYKMKTTNTNRYSVRPNAAVIQPRDSLTVVITQKAFQELTTDFHYCGDLFQLLLVRLADVPSYSPLNPTDPPPGHDHLLNPLGYSSPMKLWEFAPSSYVAKKKFTVKIQIAVEEDDVQMVVEQKQQEQQQATLNTQEVHNVESTPASQPFSTVPLPSLTVDPIDNTDITPSPSKSDPVASAAVKTAPPIRAVPTPPNSHQGAASSSKSTASVPPTVTKPYEKPTTSDGITSSQVTPSTKISSMKTPATVTPTKKKSLTTNNPPSSPVIDYKSIEFARERAVQMRIAPKIAVPDIDTRTKQRVAVERAGELVRVINDRQREIDAVKKDLLEARHKLSDARIATQPAYDVRYEINESARVPYIQICIMAIISGALLQLLV